ncbi:MAG: archaeosortase/exosortase family protein [Verrucomicrobiota bacterium]
MARGSVIFIRRPERAGWKVAAVVLLVAAAFWPVVSWYGRRMMDGSDDPWGVAALGLAAWFLWVRREELVFPEWGRLAAAGVIAGYALGYAWIPALVRGLLLVICFGLVAGLFCRHLALVALLALSLPVMASVQFYFGYPLRVMVAMGCEVFLAFGGLEVVREGTGLNWGGEQVVVDAPCSGVRMLWTGLVAHFAVCAWFRVEGWRLWILSAVAVLLLLVANIVRATVLFFPEAGVVKWPESAHELVGLVVFGLVVFLLVKMQHLFPRGKEVYHHALG